MHPRVAGAVRRLARTTCAALGAWLALSPSRSTAGAQVYAPVPTPVLEPRSVGAVPLFSVYVQARHLQRDGSPSELLRSARATVTVKPASFALVRLQAGYSNEQRPGSSDTTFVPFTVTDAYIELVPPDSAAGSIAGSGILAVVHPALLVGQFKVPFSMEYLTSSARLRSVNRSQVVDRLSPRRDIGAMAQVDVGRRVIVAGAVVNGQGTATRGNPDARDLAVGRLTLVPVDGLAVAGKLGNEGRDHLWGYDVRLVRGDVVVEGEVIHRRRPTSGAIADAGGGYVLALYRVAPWMESLVKWERFTQLRPSTLRSTWFTSEINLATPHETVRAQFARTDKRDEPGARTTEYVAQLTVLF